MLGREVFPGLNLEVPGKLAGNMGWPLNFILEPCFGLRNRSEHRQRQPAIDRHGFSKLHQISLRVDVNECN